ncbi:MAG TPA: hypothetical protein VN682_27965 [Terriglobales bacterium]|nr:hypothetical protein [Terriglobales bacterium]
MRAWNDPTQSLLTGPKGRALGAVVLELAVLADAASVGVGVAGYTGQTASEQDFYNQADKALEYDSDGSSLCCEIDKSRLRVLPKMHTPQNGLTIRSLSMHLALCQGHDITPLWVLSGAWSKPLLTSSLNLLLVPWPEHVRPSQFAESAALPANSPSAPSQYGFFSYSPSPASEQNLVNRIHKLLLATEELIGKERIDVVVLPELSITQSTYEEISPAIQAKKALLIAGVVGEHGRDKRPVNQVLCDVPGLKQLRQRKHHRWCLDRSQIEQYGIGSQLNPEMTWWEHLDLRDRNISFLSLMPWLVLSVLICEDLARPDPAGDLIRAVGPNLVITLLMDGPQIKERWSARYATTLADDPGSSVLTLTSIGMSSLSRPFAGPSRSRVVALWKDAKRSAPVEIELPEGYDGLVLSLTARWFEEYTADGRSDHKSASHPVLSGIHPVRI